MDRFTVHLCFIDKRQESQIVSNVLDVPLQVSPPRGFLDKWSKIQPGKSTLLRSNYLLPDVVLKIELFRHVTSCGTYEIPLLDSEGKCALKLNKPLDIKLNNYLITLDFIEPTPKQIGSVDCLPDILICPEEWVEMIAQFRMVCARVLAEKELNPFPSSKLCIVP